MSDEHCETPDAEVELASAWALSMVPGLGISSYHALVNQFGSAQRVFAASVAELMQNPRITEEKARLIGQARENFGFAEELAACQQHGVEMVSSTAGHYPCLLREIHDPPPILYVRGALKTCDGLAIAMVGTRRCTHYGRQQAERLAAALAGMGFTIVSGLARGIDAAAHRGALSVGGRTLAVLAGGLANIYPPEHLDLAETIAATGALVSEVPMRQQPLTKLFPQRNRIISGLALGVVVVEAGLRSGASITARHAMEQGREVWAVPGRIDSPASQGCHRMIQDGAKLVQSPQDVVDELGPLIETIPDLKNRDVQHPAELALNDVQRRVLEQIASDAISTETIIAQTGMPAGQVLAILSMLELKHLVHRLAGNQYCRT